MFLPFFRTRLSPQLPPSPVLSIIFFSSWGGEGILVVAAKMSLDNFSKTYFCNFTFRSCTHDGVRQVAQPTSPLLLTLRISKFSFWRKGPFVFGC